ncbi:hypothetical protein SEA_ADGERS_63 [Gordonia phage Adgers]|uniref:Uncharacterized protein n=4 Tax=Montyvirus TaxID=2733196 RepID=A0A2L1IVF9_9CAUD|nr:hypothetical protein HWB50_gp071 [Gordonia phage Adgers]AVD99569.1 hypothetical protein SEA_BONEHAM_64 [Gordonia phage Boneham]QAY16450.1 hypothetical protein SEA_MSAY19_65 [Gordonia phage Msay19]QAY16701.1 hypothetical protein SEA_FELIXALEJANDRO_65 [Gordonia phage FelixAlejandro]QAY16988.1 hypothetical protein SEA_BUTTERBALL_63 [Gordonia phage Butterball]AVD99158.1 hypothetical protein SEA_ADGERS_63 [Gordonia phage Adgers]
MKFVPKAEDVHRTYKAYRYREAGLSEVWNTSVPRTVSEAIAYIDWVERHFPDCRIEFIEGTNDLGESVPIKWEILSDNGERTPFVSTLERGLSRAAE